MTNVISWRCRLGARHRRRSATRSGSALRVYLSFAALGVILAALSLLYHPTPTYDPWSWLVWGRQLLHGHLALAQGPSWKPMPVIFTSVFALFGAAAPNLWLVLARAGLIVTVLMLFRLGLRITAQLDARAGCEPAVLAGLIAAVGFLLGPGIVRDSALGNSEGILIATTLIALELAFDGNRRAAFALGVVAALDRPETWIVWVPFGVWLAWRDRRARALVPTLLLAVLLLWFLPQKLGAGSYTSSVGVAKTLHLSTVASSSCPFCTDITKVAWPLVPWRIRVPALAAAAVGLITLVLVLRRGAGIRRARHRELALMLWGLCAAAGFGWLIVIAVESESGFSGSARYMMLGMAMIYLAAGIGYGLLAILLGRLARALARRRRRGPAAGGGGRAPLAVGALVAAAAFLLVPGWAGNTALSSPTAIPPMLRSQGLLREQAAALIARAGGADRLVGCGQILAEYFQVPMLSWYLQVPFAAIDIDPAYAARLGRPAPVAPGQWPRVVFRDAPSAGAVPHPGLNRITAWERRAGRRYTTFSASEMELYTDCDRTTAAGH